jgi:hypothetical protein
VEVLVREWQTGPSVIGFNTRANCCVDYSIRSRSLRFQRYGMLGSRCGQVSSFVVRQLCFVVHRGKPGASGWNPQTHHANSRHAEWNLVSISEGRFNAHFTASAPHHPSGMSPLNHRQQRLQRLSSRYNYAQYASHSESTCSSTIGSCCIPVSPAPLPLPPTVTEAQRA